MDWPLSQVALSRQTATAHHPLNAETDEQVDRAAAVKPDPSVLHL